MAANQQIGRKKWEKWKATGNPDSVAQLCSDRPQSWPATKQDNATGARKSLTPLWIKALKHWIHTKRAVGEGLYSCTV
jgi:hypothetical protein